MKVLQSPFRRKVAGVLMCLGLLPGCLCLGPNAVFFQDRALESAVRAELHMPFGCLSTEDLQRVVEVQATSLNIQTLDGLENCPNLLELNAANNGIVSISELSSLANITTLDLSFNEITNIEPLAGLFFLKTLNLEGNTGIRDWAALEANVTNGGLQGGTVIVDAAAVQDSEGNDTASFASARAALQTAGVNVLVSSGS